MEQAQMIGKATNFYQVLVTAEKYDERNSAPYTEFLDVLTATFADVENKFDAGDIDADELKQAERAIAVAGSVAWYLFGEENPTGQVRNAILFSGRATFLLEDRQWLHDYRNLNDLPVYVSATVTVDALLENDQGYLEPVRIGTGSFVYRTWSPWADATHAEEKRRAIRRVLKTADIQISAGTFLECETGGGQIVRDGHIAYDHRGRRVGA